MVSSFFCRKPPVIPGPGQRVRLRTQRERWRGNFRTVSFPHTDEGLRVVLRIAEVGEYREAVREDRRTFGMPWLVHQILPVSPSEVAAETQELPS